MCVQERPGKGKDLGPEGQALSPHVVSNLVAGAGVGLQPPPPRHQPWLLPLQSGSDHTYCVRCCEAE